MPAKSDRNVTEMNDEPNSRQQPLVGFTLEKVKTAREYAGRAKKNADEILWHRLEREEIIRCAAMVASDLATVIKELSDAQLAGK